MKKTYRSFRRIALAEGISFLVLLFIAMPMKYLASLPLAVSIVGGLHGLLFIAFLIMMWEVKSEFKKDWGWVAKALIASILPFGTIVMDKQWRNEEARAEQG